MKLLEAPLKNIKVLDFTRGFLNYGGLFLADLGANVIKVEDIASKDGLHYWEPPFHKSSPYIYLLARNKKSLAVNLREKKGHDLIHQMISKSDVMLENFRPNVMKKMGFDYASVAQKNPSLVYCSISCFDPKDNRPGHSVTTLAKSGLLSYSGSGETPELGGGLGIDISCVTYALGGIIAALYRRAMDPMKRGDHVQICMADTLMSKNMLAICKYNVDKEVPQNGKDFSNGLNANYNIYPTKDGKFVAVGAFEKKFSDILCNLIGRPDLTKIDFLQPGETQEKLKGILREKIKEKTAVEWESIFEKNQCCCSVIHDLKQALEDKDFRVKNGVLERVKIDDKDIDIIRTPIRMKHTERVPYKQAEDIGESTQKILAEELGMSEKEMEELKKKGIII